MDELTKLFAASPQAAMVGATVYLLLTTRRIESRVEAIALQVGIAPRQKKSRRWIGVLLAACLAVIALGCKSAMRDFRPEISIHIPEETRGARSPGRADPGSAKVQ